MHHSLLCGEGGGGGKGAKILFFLLIGLAAPLGSRAFLHEFSVVVHVGTLYYLPSPCGFVGITCTCNLSGSTSQVSMCVCMCVCVCVCVCMGALTVHIYIHVYVHSSLGFGSLVCGY